MGAPVLTYNLKPVEAVSCQLHKRLMSVEDCRTCVFCEGIRQPWYYWAVKCTYPDDPEAPGYEHVIKAVYEVDM